MDNYLFIGKVKTTGSGSLAPMGAEGLRRELSRTLGWGGQGYFTYYRFRISAKIGGTKHVKNPMDPYGNGVKDECHQFSG
jgi:hypothetical protein